MSNLQHWQTKIQEKRKATQWREFVMEICSWYPLNIYKVDNTITRYPQTDRRGVVGGFGTKQESANPIDITNNFLESFIYLYQSRTKSPLMSWGENENSDYTDVCYGAKDSYLSFSLGLGVQRGLYSWFSADNCSDVYNSISVVSHSSQIYSSINITNSYLVFYSSNIQLSNNIWFCKNMNGCSECFNCRDLTNQNYCIDNVCYDKVVYFEKKLRLLAQKDDFENHKNELLLCNMGNIGSSDLANCVGVNRSHNIKNGYLSSDVLDSRNVILFSGGDGGSNNFFDGIDIGFNSNHFYGTCQAGGDSSHMYLYLFGGGNAHNCFYSMNLSECSFCLGCIGLENKSYCILNKQYSKEEWYDKVDEIFGQMDTDGILGEFFPASMNPFYFNDTAAYLIDSSFTKEEVVAKGYLWRDEPIKVDIPEGAQIVKTNELGEYEGRMIGTDFYPSTGSQTPHDIDHPNKPTTTSGPPPLSGRMQELQQESKRHIDPSILKKIIQDPEGNIYRIVPMEYEFLMKHGLPLPRKHRLDRMKENFKIN